VPNILNVIRLKHSDSTSSTATVIWNSLYSHKLDSMFESYRCEFILPHFFWRFRTSWSSGIRTKRRSDYWRSQAPFKRRITAQSSLHSSALNSISQGSTNDWTYTQGHALAVTLSKHTHRDTRVHTPHLLIAETAADPLAHTRGEEFPVFNRQKCVNLWFFTIGRRQMDSFTLSLFSARARGSASKRRGYPPLIKGGGWELERSLDRWTAFTKEPGIFEPRLWSIFN